MRENPNINEKEDIMTYIYAVESDEKAKQAAEKKERVQQIEEIIQSKVWEKDSKRKAAHTSAITAACWDRKKQIAAGKHTLIWKGRKELTRKEETENTDKDLNHNQEAGNQDMTGEMKEQQQIE